MANRVKECFEVCNLRFLTGWLETGCGEMRKIGSRLVKEKVLLPNKIISEEIEISPKVPKISEFINIVKVSVYFYIKSFKFSRMKIIRNRKSFTCEYILTVGY